MDWPLKIQGRLLTEADVKLIQELMRDNPSMHRTALSRELCRRWHWLRPDGQLKDMACRELLRKLENRSLIQLPPRLRSGPKRLPSIEPVAVDERPVDGELKAIRPVKIVDARASVEKRTRQDRYLNIKVPIKDIWLYPLHRDFRQRLLD